MFAYIPARGGSKRIPRKNVKLLAGIPVLGRTIEQLVAVDNLSAIFVSTDDEEIREIAEKHGAQCVGFRSPELADDESGFIDLIHRDLPRFIEATGGDTEVLFVLATAALVPTTIYQNAVQVFLQDRPDILMSAARYPVSPYWALEEKEGGYWSPITPQHCYTASKDLPDTMMDAGLFYIFDFEVMQQYDSLKIVDRLQLYKMSDRYSVDVDEPEDWENLEFKYSGLKRSSS